MNCKLEKFWNQIASFSPNKLLGMNCKLEKFWNTDLAKYEILYIKWTVNLKSFEIVLIQ